MVNCNCNINKLQNREENMTNISTSSTSAKISTSSTPMKKVVLIVSIILASILALGLGGLIIDKVVSALINKHHSTLQD